MSYKICDVKYLTLIKIKGLVLSQDRNLQIRKHRDVNNFNKINIEQDYIKYKKMKLKP